MSRNPYADSRMQNFWKNAIETETRARLAAFTKLRGQSHSKSRQLEVLRKRIEDSRPSNTLLERVEPIRAKHRCNKNKLDASGSFVAGGETADWKDVPEMRPVSPLVKETLYDGFTREGKGRRLYMRQRYDKNPEDKFLFPSCSSWDYGWRLNDDEAALKCPIRGRLNIMRKTFYSKNGVESGCKKIH